MAYSPYFSAFMQMMMLDYVAQKVTQRKVIHKKIPYSMERHLLLPSHTQEAQWTCWCCYTKWRFFIQICTYTYTSIPYSLNFCYSSPWFCVVSVVSLHWYNTDVVQNQKETHLSEMKIKLVGLFSIKMNN